MITTIKAIDNYLECQYDDAAERNKHVNELLSNGWVLNSLGGSNNEKEPMFAKFSKEEN